MSKTTTTKPSPNVTKVNELWTQWSQPTKESSLSLDTLSINPENARQIKLAIYKSIIDFYHQETNGRMYKKRWEELHDPKLAEIGLEKRLESGIKGKDSANVKYKDHNWFGAMYTYAIAWGCLIPYHLDDTKEDDPMKKEIASLEAAIWSNIAACSITGSADSNLDKEQLPTVVQIGIKAARCCVAMKSLATVGIIKKACNRGIQLRDKLNAIEKEKYLPEEELRKWKKQVELLDGLDDKSLFSAVEEGKRIM